MDNIPKEDYFLAEIKCAVKNFCSSYSTKCEECEHNGQVKRIVAPPRPVVPPKPSKPFPNPFAFLHKQKSVYKKEPDWKDF